MSRRAVLALALAVAVLAWPAYAAGYHLTPGPHPAPVAWHQHPVAV